MENDDIDVHHLHKSYGDQCVVNDISFHVKKGEIFGLLGHNGAGKSTLLECLLGVCQKDSGEISILGLDPIKQRKKLFQQIGIQFQEMNYPDKMNVIEACEVAYSLYQDRANIDELLRQFHLEPFKKRRINELSGGERQRLSVLLALVPKPKLVFLDELTTGLDTQARREIWAYLEALKMQGMSILLTSHYMEEVEVLCDRILILKKGQMQFMGSVEDAKRISNCTSLEDAYLWFQAQEVNEHERVLHTVKG